MANGRWKMPAAGKAGKMAKGRRLNRSSAGKSILSSGIRNLASGIRYQ